MEKLVLIDGNSLLNRAFYATPLFTTKSGTPTNAVFGFVKLLLKIINDKKPTYLAVAFDVHAPTFRHKMYEAYKAGRKPMPDDLAVQFPLLKDLLRAMKINICELEGYEADDIIGTLAKRFSVPTYIYTGDRDAYQLVDETTSVCFTKKGVSDLLELNAENFRDEIGVTPSQIIDLKALMGDKSDNIPGVAGVGEKSAYSLLNDYFDLDGVYAHIDELKGALKTKLETRKEDAYFSKKLATILTEAPVEAELSDCLLQMPFSVAVREKFAEFEFRSLLSLPIFNEEEEVAPVRSTVEPTVDVVTPETVQQAIEIVKASHAEYIACDWSEKGFCFYLSDCLSGNVVTEYSLPIKQGLLDVGVYEYQLNPLLRLIFGGEKTIVAYNTKELRRKLAEVEISFTSSFEDVGILKCITEGLSNTDSLDFCLTYYALPLSARAYGAFRLREIYAGELNEREKELYYSVELPLSEVLFDMESEGISVNLAVLNELSAKYQAEQDEVTERIYELAREKFNVNSTQQLGAVLFEKLLIGQGQKKAKNTRSYKTTAEELEKYRDEHPIIEQILRYRQIQKLRSTYLEGFRPLIKEGKVHTTYSQINTSTGRLSSANPNLQNIPVRTEEGRILRKLFLASEGNLLVDADYSQIELRLLAHFSGCKELIQAYCEGKDIHASTASQVFGVPLEKVTSQMRREAKAVNFGIIYGMSSFGLSKDLGISAKKAQEYIDRYFATYSSVKEYMNGNVQSAKDTGYTTTLLGRRRVINELKSSNYNLRSFGERAAMNMPLQGSSADIIKLAMLKTAKALKEQGLKAKLVLQVHDELIIDCPEAEVEAVKVLLKEAMETAVSLSVPLTVDVGVGKDWYEAK